MVIILVVVLCIIGLLLYANRHHYSRHKGNNNSTGWENCGKVPPWVSREIVRIRKRYGGTSSSLLDKYWIIKGHHYVYKISFGGQGGPITYVSRRKRK